MKPSKFTKRQGYVMGLPGGGKPRAREQNINGSNRVGSGGGRALCMGCSFFPNISYQRPPEDWASKLKRVIMISDCEIKLGRFNIKVAHLGVTIALYIPQSSLLTLF